MASETITVNTRCCIAGGGPAGIMLGYLLARAGVPVVVLEKHADFLRDFRGDTVHSSTLEVMLELGLLNAFLSRPHQEACRLDAVVRDTPVTLADFSHLPTRCKFIAFMPQWEFLNFLAEEAKQFPHFDLRMQAKATELIEEKTRVRGVRAETPNGTFEVRADLVVAADGRHSDIRRAAGFEVIDIGAPMDALWMSMSRQPGDPTVTAGRFAGGRFFITIDRGDFWQCAYVIPKGRFDEIRFNGLDAFHEDILKIAPFLKDRVAELDSWDKIKLLTVAVDRLRRWAKPGLLCIGDAAHAMSPAGGVGINLAVQDAVAAANLLSRQLKTGAPTLAQLETVQRRREFPTRMTQRIQVFLHNYVVAPGLAQRQSSSSLPLPLKILRWFPVLRRLPGRIVGLGFRPEHVAPFLRQAARTRNREQEP